MKKTVRRILAAIMVLAMIFACVPTAFAATASSDNYYDVVSGTGYDDVMRIPYGKITTLKFKSVSGTKSICCYSTDDTIVNIPDCESAKAFGATDGAVFVYVDHFDKNGDIIATRRYIVVVYDDYDKECTGRVTDLYANDMSVKCYDEYYFDCWADTDGEVCYYILSDNLTWNSVSVDGSWFYAQDKGTDIIQLYAVDTNCNVVETTCNVTARFTFFQMISNFFNSIFSWFYRF